MPTIINNTLSGAVDVLAGERDARTIYDIACIREEKHDASREDLEFKAIALRNYQFCAAVAGMIEVARHSMPHLLEELRAHDASGRQDYPNLFNALRPFLAALARVGGAQ